MDLALQIYTLARAGFKIKKHSSFRDRNLSEDETYWEFMCKLYEDPALLVCVLFGIIYKVFFSSVMFWFIELYDVLYHGLFKEQLAEFGNS